MSEAPSPRAAEEPAMAPQPSLVPQALLAARHLRKRVRDGKDDLLLLTDISIDIAAGERVALLGPSGSGKSTLLNILGALDPDFEGEVRIAGASLAEMRDAELAAFRNRTLGFAFQAYNLLGHLTVLENVLLPGRFSAERIEAQRAIDVLERVGLHDKAHRRPTTLSGGERQRVAIARALYNRPKLVLCDEPTGNLDHNTGHEVLRLFEQLTRDGVALLIATHDEAIATSAHRVLRLAAGVLV
jgi:putative ABC transport system ATP-binding protein